MKCRDRPDEQGFAPSISLEHLRKSYSAPPPVVRAAFKRPGPHGSSGRKPVSRAVLSARTGSKNRKEYTILYDFVLQSHTILADFHFAAHPTRNLPSYFRQLAASLLEAPSLRRWYLHSAELKRRLPRLLNVADFPSPIRESRSTIPRARRSSCDPCSSAALQRDCRPLCATLPRTPDPKVRGPHWR